MQHDSSTRSIKEWSRKKDKDKERERGREREREREGGGGQKEKTPREKRKQEKIIYQSNHPRLLLLRRHPELCTDVRERNGAGGGLSGCPALCFGSPLGLDSVCETSTERHAYDVAKPDPKFKLNMHR